MRLNQLLILIVLACFTACYSFNGKPQSEPSTPQNIFLAGDTVMNLGENIMVVYQDSKNVYWFGSWETGLYAYDGKALVQYTTKHGLTGNRINEIKEDRLGNLYVNTSGQSQAIVRYDGQAFLPLIPHLTNDWELWPNDLWYKASDNQGHVYRFDGEQLHALRIPNPPNLSGSFEVYSIYTDAQGNVWFGTNPFGVCRYNGKSFDWITEKDVTELDGGPANGVRSIIQDKEGYFWFNSAYRYRVFDSVSVQHPVFYERTLSIGNLDGKTNSNLHEYLSITSDRNNNLWIATYRNGVWKYDGKTTKHYLVQEHGQDIPLFYLYTDRQGNIWLGTHQNGVWQLQNDHFVRFSI